MWEDGVRCGRMVRRAGGWCEVWEDGEMCGRMVLGAGVWWRWVMVVLEGSGRYK